MDGVRWKHKKTGNIYRIVDFVIIEKTLTPAVCYEPVVEPGGLFVRPCKEFFDGRFEMISADEVALLGSVPRRGSAAPARAETPAVLEAEGAIDPGFAGDRHVLADRVATRN